MKIANARYDNKNVHILSLFLVYMYMGMYMEPFLSFKQVLRRLFFFLFVL
jgi:hypothetical protein